MLGVLFTLRSLRVDHRTMLRAVANRYGATNVDFIDAYHALEIARSAIERLGSYDRDFDALEVTRVEPADV